MDQTKNFWLDLFTCETWNEFLKHGGKVSGFRESRWSTVQKVTSGDVLLCYLTGVSRFGGALEVVGHRQMFFVVLLSDGAVVSAENRGENH